MTIPQSLADSFLSLPLETRQQRLSKLKPNELAALQYNWDWWARDKQRMPTVPFFIWLILAGRGFGKTRTGVEAVRIWSRTNRYVNLIGATADDARDIMIEGESGILACCPPGERPDYVRSSRKLVWPNGCISLIFTADEPERLRGKQHMKLWADEVASWRYPEAWAQAMMGLRLGDNPQGIVTTTPRPTNLIKALMADPRNYITSGTTYENRANLAPGFFEYVIAAYENTRLGRQELNAEILEEAEGALWSLAMLDQHRVTAAPELVRTVIAVDPAVTSKASSDETGIIVEGIATNRHVYVMDDGSGIYKPIEWAQKVMHLYDIFNVDAVVCEVNNGGELVEANLRAAGFDGKIVSVYASKGKRTRAEPISSLYEQGRIHHVGVLASLENQMTTWSATSGESSPDRIDALVWGVTELMSGVAVTDEELAAYGKGELLNKGKVIELSDEMKDYLMKSGIPVKG